MNSTGSKESGHTPGEEEMTGPIPVLFCDTGIEPGSSYILGKGSTTELYPQTVYMFYFEKESYEVDQAGSELVIFLP